MDKSYEEIAGDVNSAFMQMNNPAAIVETQFYPHIEDTFSNYVIAEVADSEYYRIDYTIDATGAIVFADRSTWQRMEEQWVAMKAGRRNNAKDQSRLQMIHDYAAQNGANCNPASKSVKATGLDTALTEYQTPELAIKTAGEMELDVCYMPYNGQYDGKDSDGEYFTKSTKDYSSKFPKPLALYYHGYKAQGKKQEEPFEIGECGKRWEDVNGRWIRIKLDPSIPEAVKTWNDAKQGKARASSGSIAHLVRRQSDGHITHFPVVEVSVFDTSDGKRPANSYALANPAAKAHGFDVETLEEEAEEVKELASITAALAVSIIKSQR